MSVIKKIPAIEVILGRLNATQLAAVKTAVNSTDYETPKSLIDPSYKLSIVNADNPTDIAAYRLEMDAQKVRNGIMIRVYSSGLYEHFLVYGESQKITIYEINSAKQSYVLIEEYCDINELRRCLEEHQEAPGDTWVEKMKEHLDYSPTTEERIGGVEVGTNLHVDGSLYVNSNVGHIVRQDDFMDLTSVHSDITITDFSVYELGQFVIGHFKYSTESIAANEKLFDIKNAYKPKKELVKLCVNNNGEAIAYKMLTTGEVDTLSSVSGTPAKTVYMDFIYEV